MSTPAAPLWRRVAVGILSVASMFALAWEARNSTKPYELLIPIVSAIIAGIVVHLPAVGPQLLTRSILWANMLLGFAIVVLSGNSKQWSGPALCLGNVLALAIAGRRAITNAHAAGGHKSVRHPQSHLLLMVFALADAQTYLLFGFLEYRSWVGIVLFAATALLVLGFVGLYRQQLWGAICNFVVSFGIAGIFACSLVVGKPREAEFYMVIVVLAVLHIVAALPMLIASYSNRELPQLPVRIRPYAGYAVLGAIALTTGAAALVHQTRYE
jgi:hypothetical protein